MVWQENLFQNLLALIILLILGIIIYARITGNTIPDLIRGLREASSPVEQ
jgi:hypothetical protein